MLLHFDATIIVIAISFIIFAAIMHHVFYLPMRRVIEERDDYVNSHKDEAKKLTDEAKEIITVYNQKLNKARLTGQATIESTTVKAKGEKSQIISTASNNAHDEIKTARTALNEEKNKAVEVLKNDVAPLAQQIIAKLLSADVAISGIDQEKVEKILRS
ncbi:MAG: hypothetical protein AB1782_18000 [Cyanobacteriota bacterium]